MTAHAMMTFGQRLLGLLVLLGVLASVQIGIHLVRWSATAEQRAELRELREEIYDAGARVIATRARADTLRSRLEVVDDELDAGRRSVERYQRWTRDGRLPPSLFEAYRSEVDRFDEARAGRQRLVGQWETAMNNHRQAIDDYNRLLTHLRVLAAEIGEPYYPAPSPAEAAIERGLLPPP